MFFNVSWRKKKLWVQIEIIVGSGEELLLALKKVSKALIKEAPISTRWGKRKRNEWDKDLKKHEVEVLSSDTCSKDECVIHVLLDDHVNIFFLPFFIIFFFCCYICFPTLPACRYYCYLFKFNGQKISTDLLSFITLVSRTRHNLKNS